MSVRPLSFEDFNGQPEVIRNLAVAVRSALRQQAPLAHMLFAGPAGLGKTTLAMSVLPTELECECRAVNCAAIEKATDLTRVLSTVGEGQLLFLDEIHALIPAAREHLLTAMEDRRLSVKVGDGDQANVIEVELPEFTVVGATTRQGLLDGPLRSRFRHIHTLEPYDDQAMERIVCWHADARNAIVDPKSVGLLLGPAHGIARRAVNLLEACIDSYFGQKDEPGCMDTAMISVQLIEETLDRLGFIGPLDRQEWRYLTFLRQQTKPVGLKTLAAVLDESQATIEEVYEPWILRQGLLAKHPTGREITPLGKHFMARLEQ